MNKALRKGEDADSTLRDMYDHVFHPERKAVDEKRRQLVLIGGITLAVSGLVAGIGMQGCARCADTLEDASNYGREKLQELIYRALDEMNTREYDKSLFTLKEAEVVWGKIEDLKGNPSIKRSIDCVRARALARKATIVNTREEAAELYLKAYEIATQVKDDSMGMGAREDLLREMDKIAGMLEEKWDAKKWINKAIPVTGHGL